MLKLPALSLRTRTLVLVAAVALAPFGLLAFGVVLQLRTTLEAEARADHLAIVSRLRGSVHATFVDLQRQVGRLAIDPRVQSMRPERLHDALHNFLGFNDDFISIFVYDPKRTIRFIEFRNHFAGVQHMVGKSALELTPRLLPALQQVMRDDAPTYVDYLRKETAESQLLLLLPIPPFTGVGPPVGVLSCAVQMYSHEFQDILDELQLEDSTYCLILDRQDRVLARKGDETAQGIVSVKVPRNGDEAIDTPARWMEVANRVDLVTCGALKEIGAAIVVGRSRNAVLALSDRLTRRIAWIAALALVLALLSGFGLARSLVGPILELTLAIQQVGDGATGHRVRIRGDDELARAGEAFNRMAAQLQKGQLMENIWSRHWSPPGTPSAAPAAPEREPSDDPSGHPSEQGGAGPLT